MKNEGFHGLDDEYVDDQNHDGIAAAIGQEGQLLEYLAQKDDAQGTQQASGIQTEDVCAILVPAVVHVACQKYHHGEEENHEQPVVFIVFIRLQQVGVPAEQISGHKERQGCHG